MQLMTSKSWWKK